jgi:hypothetical protein
MKAAVIRLIVSVILCQVVVPVVAQDREANILSKNAYDLTGSGQALLLNEAQRVDFFMLGELHGEKEIPELLTSMWPSLYKNGYHHIAGEISTWAASKLEFSDKKDSLRVEGLWTNREARTVRSLAAKDEAPLLWGCDMEEISLGDLIKEFFQENPSNINSTKILSTISEGYNRKLAPNLLSFMSDLNLFEKFNNNELFQSIMISLRIDSARAFPGSRFKAQLLREEYIKRSLLKNYNSYPTSKVFLRFGRNHLHYGFDERGISTLGNFVSEFSLSKNMKCFNVAAFAAGGECRLMGETFSADERNDDLAFRFFSEHADHNATVFDLRPLRIYLHTIPSEKRSEIQQRLSYWADSYDAIICYRHVTPR